MWQRKRELAPPPSPPQPPSPTPSPSKQLALPKINYVICFVTWIFDKTFPIPLWCRVCVCLSCCASWANFWDFIAFISWFYRIYINKIFEVTGSEHRKQELKLPLDCWCDSIMVDVILTRNLFESHLNSPENKMTV